MRILGWISYLSKNLNKKYVKIGITILYTICYLSPIVGYLLPISNFQKNIQEFANSFMGVLIYMLMVTAISDIIKLVLFKILKLKNYKVVIKMTTKEFDYSLPEELIAQTPIKNRSESKLMILDKKTGKRKMKYLRTL